MSENLDYLYNMVESDVAKREILKKLMDGDWHDVVDLQRTLKSVRKTIGLVGVGTLVRNMETILADLFERREGEHTVELRLNPEYSDKIKKMLDKIEKEDQFFRKKGIFY